MTGAGFGGCTVSIVRSDMASDFIKKVGSEYKEKTGIAADFYMAETGNGAMEV
jgi:galactokinase